MHAVTYAALQQLAVDMQTTAKPQTHWAGELEAILAADGMAAAAESVELHPSTATAVHEKPSRRRSKPAARRKGRK